MPSTPWGDRLLIGFGVLLAAGPVLLGYSVHRPLVAFLVSLGAMIAGAAVTAVCGYPVAAAGGSIVFGTGAILLLPPIGGLAGLLLNLGFLTTAILIAVRYFRQAIGRS